MTKKELKKIIEAYKHIQRELSHDLVDSNHPFYIDDLIRSNSKLIKYLFDKNERIS